MQCIRLTISLLSLLCSLANADISTDGSVGPAQTLNANNGQYTIGQELGSLRGSNLFHSFQQFNINRGEGATFTGDNSIHNVISRVTGGSASTINGMLKSQIGNADFYFINPAGVIFGEHAQVDVPAAFHVSTAGELKFADGASYSAINPDASTLTIAEPNGFGFTQGQTGKLQIIGGQLSFRPGTDVSLSANSLTIAGMELSNGESQQAAITVQQTNPATEQGIHLSLTAVDTATSQIIPVNGLAATATGGEIHITNSIIDSSGNGLGQIGIRAGEVTLEDSLLFADNTGDTNMNAGNGVDVIVHSLILDNTALTNDVLGKGNANTVIVRASEAVQVLNGGFIQSLTVSEGNAGSVTVEAGTVLIDRQGSEFVTGINSDAAVDSQGNAGTVVVNASKIVQVLNGGQISSATFSIGDAGSVMVEAVEVLVDRQGSEFVTGINSDAAAGSQGDAGMVLVNASESVQVLNGGEIRSLTFGAGDAGSVTVSAGEVLIDGRDSGFVSSISSSAQPDSEGKAGTVVVRASEIVQVLNGGQISSATFSIGDAGNVTLDAREILVDRQGSSIVTSISSSAEMNSEGKAGTVLMMASEVVQVLNGGQINSSTFSIGDAGSVMIEAREVLVDRQGSEFVTSISSSAQPDSQGHAGTVLVNASDLIKVSNGGQIDSVTFAVGDAGSVVVEAREVIIDGQGSGFVTSIGSSAQPDSLGKAGTVLVKANESVQVLNGGQISSATFSVDNAGSVTVEAKEVLVDRQGSEFVTSISSSAEPSSQGHAGTVFVQATEVVQVVNGGKIDSVTFAAGNAGSVTVETEEVLIDGQESVFSTGIFSTSSVDATGQVGNVSIVATKQIIVHDGTFSIASENEQLQLFSGDAETLATLRINTPILQLQQNSSIDATANGGVNAAPIEITVADSLNIKNSQISTSAVNGNGGPITINAGNWLQLQQSQLTTSVSGQENGNGGDINVNTPVIVLDTGFIQANTAATQAQGGDINLHISQLIPSGNILLVGGAESLKFDSDKPNFNVIQAASPTGINGTINITSPELNITGVLASVNIPELNLDRLGQDPCTRQRENSLKSLGHGGVPALQHGENYLQINRLNIIDQKQGDKESITLGSGTTSKYLPKQRIVTDCVKQQLFFSQAGG